MEPTVPSQKQTRGLDDRLVAADDLGLGVDADIRPGVGIAAKTARLGKWIRQQVNIVIACRKQHAHVANDIRARLEDYARAPRVRSFPKIRSQTHRYLPAQQSPRSSR